MGLNSRNNRLDIESQTLIAISGGQPTEDISPTLCGANDHANQVPTIAFERRRTELNFQEDLSPTLNPGGGGNQAPAVNHYGIRRLTPLECERLQGFPDGWTEFGKDGERISDTQRYKMLGNAVCVNVAEWIGRRMAKLHNDGFL
jgi:DNA (cytosine-5)-methyltransferase 1